jgi:hypothetical protein
MSGGAARRLRGVAAGGEAGPWAGSRTSEDGRADDLYAPGRGL